jgi:hypothetical protein
MNLQVGDVVLALIEFHQTEGGKVRPLIVALDTGDDDFVGAQVTTKPIRSQHDLTIVNWKGAGLNAPSTCRINKPSLVSKADVTHHIGLQADDLQRFLGFLCRTYCHRPT